MGFGSNMELEEMGKAEGPIDDSGKYGKPREHDPDFHGPIHKRSCTDIICLLLFVTFLAGWGVVAYFAFADGKWETLLYPTDSFGNICGQKNQKLDLTNRKYLLYFDVSKCLNPLMTIQGCHTPSVCVEKCPTEFQYNNIAVNQGRCVSEGYGMQSLAQYDKLLECLPYKVPSGPVGGRCLPGAPQNGVAINLTEIIGSNADINSELIINGTKAIGNQLSARGLMEKVFQDFANSWPMILVGLIITMIISFIWIVVMRWIAGPMVYVAIFSVLGLLSYGTYYTFAYWQMLKNRADGPDPPFEFTLDGASYLRRQDTWLAFGIICATVLGILLLIVLFLRNRIRLAVALLREASKGVQNMLFTLVFPLFPFILHLAVFAFFGLLAVLLSSSGAPVGVVVERSSMTVGSSQPASPTVREYCDIKTFDRTQNTTHECIFLRYNRDTRSTYFQLFNVFALFWAGFFVIGLGDVVLAGAFASYYWTRDKKRDLPAFPLAGSLGRTLRYHLGSVAFGSLILAIVRFIRWLLENLEQRLKNSNLGLARFLVKCCVCCIWCLENFLKFINRNAYIMIAIYGKNFCRSARDAFMLLMRNVLRVHVLDKVTDFLLLIGKLVIVGGVGTLAFFFFAGRIPGLERFMPQTQLNYYYVPAITVIIGSYLITSAFFGVYEMAVDTVFLCFLEDLERNDGSPQKPYFMSKNLMKILGKKNKKAKKTKAETST